MVLLNNSMLLLRSTIVIVCAVLGATYVQHGIVSTIWSFSIIVCSFSGACSFSVHYMLAPSQEVLLMQGYHSIVLLSGIRSNRVLCNIVCTLSGICSFPVILYAPSQEVLLMQGYHARVLLSGVCSFSVLLLCLSFVCQLSVICRLSVMCLSFVCFLYTICTNDRQMTNK